MTTYDLTPLLRTSVGFDRMARLMDSALAQNRPASTYPPYNIEKRDEERYRVSFAVAGFGEEELSIQTHNGRLTVKGQPRGVEQDEVVYLHRGIAGRGFERSFQLADHIVVEGAQLDKGLLHIDLRREVPEALKPRTIAIGSTQVMDVAAK